MGFVLRTVDQATSFRHCTSPTFEWAGSDECTEHAYSRESDPTRAALEDQIARLEGGEHGLVFASGMAAISTTMLSLVPLGVHRVVGLRL
ncbi:PLP-dependent transferase [Halostagnicola kamekurae]|uniref:PLP-dependent transferase n=1 Tax=Halostagnicola kamekurae TaxID=619731 RepID=UPI0015874881